jgi:hypothetical protein
VIRLPCPAGGSHAELVLGLVPDHAGTPRTPVSDGGNITPPALTSTDWMRRGALAERLGHVSDARAAYRASVKLGFNLAAYTALLRLEAQAGNASDTVLCAAQVGGHVHGAGGVPAVGGLCSGATALPGCIRCECCTCC